jgi:dTDP-4-amino-4,6-dideoxygalactose transaminase
MRNTKLTANNPNFLACVEKATLEYVRQMFAESERSVCEQLEGGGAIARLEEKLRNYYGVPHCLLVNSATNGLLSLALALPIVESEIITTPRSYGATWAPFELLQNRMVYATTIRGNGNIAPTSVAKLINPNTRAILAVDWLGQPHDMFALRALCDRYGLLYLADASSSFGAVRKGRPASSLADAWVISLGPRKPLPCGEGGAILTRNESLYKKLVYLTQHPDRYRREFSLTEYTDRQPLNARIHPLAAVIGLAQFEAKGYLPKNNVRNPV